MQRQLRLKTIRAILQIAGKSAWSWRRIESTQQVQWQLIVNASSTPTNIFAAGDILGELGGVIEHLHPALLDELTDLTLLDSAALDKMECVNLLLRTMSIRAQKLGNEELSDELEYVLSESEKAAALLRRNTWFSSEEEYQQWENLADTSISDPD